MALEYIKSTKELKLTRGDTAEFSLNVRVKETKEPYDYSNDTVEFTVKKNANTKQVILKKIFTDNTIKILPEDTVNLPYQTYKYSVRIITPNDDRYTVIDDRDFTITKEENDNATTD